MNIKSSAVLMLLCFMSVQTFSEICPTRKCYQALLPSDLDEIISSSPGVYNEVPEVFKHSHPALAYAFDSVREGNRRAVASYMNLDGTRPLNDGQRMPLEFYHLDPAAYLVFAFDSLSAMNIAKNRKYGNLKLEDPMYDWAQGINHYVGHYVRGHEKVESGEYWKTYYSENYELLLERPFLRAIFKSAGYESPEMVLNRYLESNMADKATILNRTMINLRNEDYRSQLIAAWAITWLVNHYDHQKELRALGDLLYEMCEIPMRELVHRIRPPRDGVQF